MCFGGGDQAANTNANPAPYAVGNSAYHVKETVTPGGTLPGNPAPPVTTSTPVAPKETNETFSPTTGLSGPM